MLPLYAKLFQNTTIHISSATIEALKWWKYALPNSACRPVDLHNGDIGFAVYTDASREPIDSGSSADSDGSDSANHLGMSGAVIWDKELHQNGFGGEFDVSFLGLRPIRPISCSSVNR